MSDGSMVPAVVNDEQLYRRGETWAATGMVGVKNAAQGFLMELARQERNMGMLDFMGTYYVIDGKLSMRADAMAAEYRRRGGKYTIIERSNKLARARFSYDNNVDVEFSYSMDDAVKAGLTKNSRGETKDNWRNHPTNMLWARMISNAIRVLAPEVNAGVYTPEETQDFAPSEEKNVTPAQDKPATAESVSKIEKLMAKSESENSTIVEAVVVEPETPSPVKIAAALKNAEVTYDVCPVGKESKGKRWDDMDSDKLRAIIGDARVKKHLTDGHMAEIMSVFEKRGEAPF